MVDLPANQLNEQMQQRQPSHLAPKDRKQRPPEWGIFVLQLLFPFTGKAIAQEGRVMLFKAGIKVLLGKILVEALVEQRK